MQTAAATFRCAAQRIWRSSAQLAMPPPSDTNPHHYRRQHHLCGDHQHDSQQQRRMCNHSQTVANRPTNAPACGQTKPDTSGSACTENTEDHGVRVRFAPSPTGYLHLGGLRTALYNYLFARAHRGTFVLRIEDTDQSRLIEGAAQQLSDDLEWAGIRPDEGPTTGGQFGPYVQSERLELYHSNVKQLIENGTAYYCFCTDRRLDLLRKEAVKARQVPRYDNRCRHLTPVQLAEKLARQEPFCIRFRMDAQESHSMQFDDMVFGRMAYDVAENEGDPVIVKSDGFPTYHFAHVVDDHLMRISHVLRGVEWQISTTKHLLLYKAFGWKPPKYGHLPLLVNADGSKLSKRQGNINIDHYRRVMGCRPQALINYITKSGGGFDHQMSSAKRVHTMEELQEMFDASKINVNSSRLNPDLLDDCNRQELIQNMRDPLLSSVLVEEVIQLVTKTYPDRQSKLDLSTEHIHNILSWATQRINTLNDLMNVDLLFLWVLPQSGRHSLQDDVLNELVQLLDSTENFQRDHLNELLKTFADDKQLKYKQFMKSMRMILSGLKEGPGVAEMIEILGKRGTIQRIRNSRQAAS